MIGEENIRMVGIDLNCDLGEGSEPSSVKIDGEIMPLVTSANIACGFHASTPLRMTETVRLAIRDAAPGAFMVCLAGSRMTDAAREFVMPFVEEAFADRAYSPDGTLAPPFQGRGRPA
jgi:lactam utilization protein B